MVTSRKQKEAIERKKTWREFKIRKKGKRKNLQALAREFMRAKK